MRCEICDDTNVTHVTFSLCSRLQPYTTSGRLPCNEYDKHNIDNSNHYSNGSTFNFWFLYQSTELCCDKWPLHRGNWIQASFLMLITLTYRYIYMPPLTSQLHHLYLLRNILVPCSQAVVNTCRSLGTILTPMLEVKGNHSFYMA